MRPAQINRDSEVADGTMKKKNISAFTSGRGEVGRMALGEIPRMIMRVDFPRPTVGTLASLVHASDPLAT